MGLAAVVPAEGRTTRVALSHMKEVLIRATRGVTAVLTHKDLGASLAVGILLVNTVNLPHMGLQRAPLCEGFLAQLTLVRTDTYIRGRQHRFVFCACLCGCTCTLRFAFAALQLHAKSCHQVHHYIYFKGVVQFDLQVKSRLPSRQPTTTC